MSSSDTRPRLRTACNECHASKVKCSGEKSGCARCLDMGTECHFEISMVGRCSKKRQRKKASVGSGDSWQAKNSANASSRSIDLSEHDDPTMRPITDTRTPLPNAISPPSS
ncbi:hypothetical protein BJ170DRAFT_695121, partial [Xylariales sp. AK1849]